MFWSQVGSSIFDKSLAAARSSRRGGLGIQVFLDDEELQAAGDTSSSLLILVDTLLELWRSCEREAYKVLRFHSNLLPPAQIFDQSPRHKLCFRILGIVPPDCIFERKDFTLNFL